jgi:hypothetical protein
MWNPFRLASKAPVSCFDPGAALKLQYAVQFLANHVTHFGPPEAAEDAQSWQSSHRAARMDDVPADVQVALNKAVVAAALYVEQVFAEGV